MRVTYTVYKNDVLTEVMRLTAYVGQRKVGDEGSYERISVTDSDKAMLEQYWIAACSAATEQLMHYARSIENDIEGDDPCYEVVMEQSSLYDVHLNESIEDSLKNFFISLIAGKWFRITSPDDEAKYAADAIGYMKDVENKLYNRKRPRRYEC